LIRNSCLRVCLPFDDFSFVITELWDFIPLRVRVRVKGAFQLYFSDQFYWWRKPEEQEKTTNQFKVILEGAYRMCMAQSFLTTILGYFVDS